MRELVTPVVVVFSEVAKYIADHLGHLIDEAQVAILLLRYVLVRLAEVVVGHIIREDSCRIQDNLIIVDLVFVIGDKAPILLFFLVFALQPLVVLSLFSPVNVVGEEAIERHL